MGKFILGFNNKGLSADYQSANTFQPELGLSQLNNEYVSAVLRTINTSDLVININLVVDHKVGVIAVSHHNLRPTATIQWIAYNDLGRSDILKDWGEITVGNFDESINIKTTVLPVDDIDAAYFTVTIKDSGHPDGFLQIGSLFIGNRFRTNCNMDYGYSSIPIDNSDIFTSDGGINSYIRKPIKRQFNMGFSLRSIEEGDKAFKLMLMQGITKRIVYQFDEDDTNNLIHDGIYTIIGNLQSLSALTYVSFNINNYNFSITEEL